MIQIQGKKLTNIVPGLVNKKLIIFGNAVDFAWAVFTLM